MPGRGGKKSNHRALVGIDEGEKLFRHAARSRPSTNWREGKLQKKEKKMLTNLPSKEKVIALSSYESDDGRIERCHLSQLSALEKKGRNPLWSETPQISRDP